MLGTLKQIFFVSRHRIVCVFQFDNSSSELYRNSKLLVENRKFVVVEATRAERKKKNVNFPISSSVWSIGISVLDYL